MENVEEVQCPACGPTSYQVWMENGGKTRYVKCKGCGTIYANPRASWKDRYAWLDDSFGYGDKAIENAKSRQNSLNHEAEIIKTYISEGCLLDIGCDLGDFFAPFMEPQWKRYGVEVASSAAEYAADEYQANVFTGTLDQADYPDEFFDVVTLLDTLYYLDNPREDFLEIHRILKPGGIFAVEITGVDYQLLRSRGILCWLTDRKWSRIQTDSSYIFWFSPEGLIKLVEGCGFPIYQVSPISSPDAERGFFYMNASRIYSNLTRRLVQISPRLYGWVPKYILVAQKQK